MYINMVHLSQLMNQIDTLLTKINHFSSFLRLLSNVLFLFQIPILNNILHLIVMSF